MNKKIWVVIPVYNNAKTIKAVAADCLNYADNVLVIDDGSTDANLHDLLSGMKLKVIRHDHNMGKGKAIMTALDFLSKIEADYMITIDGDGQHYASDLVKFVDKINSRIENEHIYIGARDFTVDNVTKSSRFGRKFSNMWYYIETGKKCSDTQSGFRAYPVGYLSRLKLYGKYYEFEVEVLARAVWAGLKVEDIDIDVHYPAPEERVSSFDKKLDNIRISKMHCRLVGRCLLPWPHKHLLKSDCHFDRTLLKDPKRFFKVLLRENASPMGLAAAAGVGTVLSVLPLIGLHTLSIIYVSTRLHLNKVMAVSIQLLYSPPFVPFLCIEMGYFIRNGKWLTDFSFASFKDHAPMVLHDWWVGALVLTPFFAILATLVVYHICKSLLKEIVDEKN